MEEVSLHTLARQLEAELSGILSGIDTYALEAKPRTLVAGLKRQMTDARLDVRDYEFSETRREQTGHARNARKRLAGMRQDILAASEYGIFTAVDVIQLSAHIDGLLDQLV